MKQLWIGKRKGNGTLILFFNGWGQDARAVERLRAEGADVLMLYAYHDGQPFDGSVLRDYAAVDVAAWSMGVWAAARTVDAREWKIRRAVALCGTERPIDDRRGIPRGVFEATLSSLTPRSLEKFAMRMAGGVAAYRQSPLAAGGSRSFDDVRAELQWWRDTEAALSDASGNGVLWQKALVGMNDGIFPAQNQLYAWEQSGVRTVQRDCAHYPFAGMERWDEAFDF